MRLLHAATGWKWYARPCALALAVMLAAGCASVRLQAPKLAVSGVSVERLSPADTRFTVFVTVSNPNDRDIAIDAIEAELRVEDVPIGKAELVEPIRVIAHGDASARLTVRADLPSSLRAAAQVASRMQAEGDGFTGIRYIVEGRATLAGGSLYPFTRRGQVPWNPRTQTGAAS